MVFSVRADERGGKRLMKLPGQEFVRRFLLHVLPAGIKRVRHYGVLVNGCKKTQFAQARRALGQAPPNRPALEAARAFVQRVSRVDFLCCPHCHSGTLRVVQTLAPAGRLPAPGVPLARQPELRASSAQARAPP